MTSIAPNGKSQYGQGSIEGSWKGMKKYLEEDMLSAELRGRVSYHLEVYPRFGRSSATFTLLLDGEAVKKFGLMYAMARLEEKGVLQKGHYLWEIPMQERDEYEAHEFCEALKDYRNQPIQESMLRLR